MNARVTALENAAPMRLQPSKKSGVADQAVFDNFGIAGAELPQRQCVKRIGIGKNERRLMESADQILAMRRVDPRFAANR